MSFLLAIFLTLLSAPLLVPLIFRLFVRLVGTYLTQKTRGRKELLLSKAAEYQNESTDRSKDTTGDDADWEKVDRNVPASAPNGEKFDGNWHGIVGFFHPFWYIPRVFVSCAI
jgi:alpha-1,2-mannosyltransferase